tara:strand:+ start:331 stop:549 length:219 start_codon:yes stop_codon:yes gene_type:complete
LNIFDRVCAEKPLFGAFLAYFHRFLQKWDFLSKIGFSQFLAHIVTYHFQEKKIINKNKKLNKKLNKKSMLFL